MLAVKRASVSSSQGDIPILLKQAAVEATNNQHPEWFYLRTKVLREMMELEKSYISQLRTVQKVFLEPLRTMRTKDAMLTEDERRAIFGDIESIWSAHVTLFQEMNKRLENWCPETTIGDVLVKSVPHFRTYVPYVTNYALSVKLLKSCERNYHDFKDFLDQQYLRPECDALPLNRHLFLPIKQLQRYTEFLTELIEATPETHKDLVLLKDAKSKFQSLSKEVDDISGDTRRRAELQELRKNVRFCPDLVEPQRDLLVEDELLEVLCHPPPQNVNLPIYPSMRGKRYMTLFLFSDSIMIVRRYNKGAFQQFPPEEKFEFERLIPLNDVRLYDVLDSDDDINGLRFKIRGSEAIYVFQGYDVEHKARWMTMLEEAISLNRAIVCDVPKAFITTSPKGEKVHIFQGHKFIKRRKALPCICHVCKDAAWPFGRRPYECSDCKMICHEDCYLQVFDPCKPDDEEDTK